MYFRCTLLIALVLISPASGAEKLTPEQIRFFETKIRPVLAESCYRCHSAQTKKSRGGLLLDTKAGIRKGGSSGPAVVPGQAEKSLLIQAIRYQNPDLQMPPNGKLPAEAIAALEEWVRSGAPDPRDEAIAEKTKGEKHWAFQPVRSVTLPTIQRADWPINAIDVFVLARLEAAGPEPLPEADRGTLIRRAYFNLIGLPPSAEEVERFVGDPSPAAYEALIDRLMASPHFGERWGRYWLDVARYADTKGYVFTQDRQYRDAFKYRDWVVRALNRDLPYDQFILQQLAADQMQKESRSLDAMGFLTLGRRFLNDIHDIIDDRIDVVTRGLMGLTVTCARCHDHKYDPIPQADYYSLYGVFSSSQEPGNAPSTLRLEDRSRPQNVRIFIRGNSRNLGREVPRQFLEVLSGKERKPFRNGSGRKEMAEAVASSDNPLTARVFVNRVWRQLFGKGLVEGPSDFGARSDPPSHPDLLDHLALGFMNQGWSVKWLIRQMVLSRTFRQQSGSHTLGKRVDPENRLLWRMNRRRLDFEAMRDTLLAAAGRLDLTVGGPSVNITRPPFSTRRTLYGRIDRQNLPSLFRTFDFASPDTHSPRRFQTSVPQQALYLFNHPFLMEMASSLFERPELQKAQAPAEKIRRLYRAIYGREPLPEERELALRFVESGSQGKEDRSVKRSHPGLDKWQQLAQVMLISNELHFVD